MKLKVKIFNFNNERYLIVLPTWAKKLVVVSWAPPVSLLTIQHQSFLLSL